MRSRNIKPGFFKNEQLAECSPLARLLFAGLPMLCDRDGRMEYRPLRIKAELFPYDTCTVRALCDELTKYGREFICIYSVAGREYLEVTHFKDHQHCHRDEPSHNYPPPPALSGEHDTSTILAPVGHDARTGEKRPLTESFILKAESSAAVGSDQDEVRQTDTPPEPYMILANEVCEWMGAGLAHNPTAYQNLKTILQDCEGDMTLARECLSRAKVKASLRGALAYAVSIAAGKRAEREEQGVKQQTYLTREQVLNER